jgi:hypothetical protein
MVKEFVTKMARVWMGYHPLLRLLQIVMLLIALGVGIAGSAGLLNEFPTW